jgi:hypothetical protein
MQAARGFLERVIADNVKLVRSHKVPRLYASGVRYCRPEREADGQQRLYNASQVIARGCGTCSDLAAWRAAELRVLGDARIGVTPCRPAKSGGCEHGFLQLYGRTLSACPNIKLYFRPHLQGIYHCEVRLPNGDAEDPSRFLGMGRSRE